MSRNIHQLEPRSLNGCAASSVSETRCERLLLLPLRSGQTPTLRRQRSMSEGRTDELASRKRASRNRV